MLIAQIDAVIKTYQEKNFTGHLKFGIEKSNIVSITELSKCEKSELNNADFKKQLFEICNDLSYGSIEFDLVFGKVERLNYCKSFNGEMLKKKIGAM